MTETISTRKWRTLVTVDSLYSEFGYVHVVIPGWHPTARLLLPLTLFPAELVALFAPEYRFHARVNIGAELAEDLQLSEFEWEGTLEEQQASIQVYKRRHGL